MAQSCLHLLQIVLKLCLCLQTDTSVSTDLHMHIIYLPAGCAAGVGDIAVSPVMAVIKVMRSNATLSLQEKQNENDIDAFQKMLGYFQKYIHVKTPTTGCHWNRMSSVKRDYR